MTNAGWTPLVDVSYAQGVIHFDVIKNAGIPGVIIRACNALKRDIRFDNNWKSAKDSGLDVAVYGFSNPKAVASGADQGSFLAELAVESSSAWIMHDEESYNSEGGPNPVLKGAAAAAWTAAKVRASAVAGVAQVLYSGQPYWDATFTPSVTDELLRRNTQRWQDDLAFLSTFDMIIARYIAQRSKPVVFDPLPRGVTPDRWAEVVLGTGKGPGVPKGFTPEQIICHQFSAGGNGQGPVYGCASTDLDLNIFRSDAYRRLFHSTGPMPVPPQPQGADDMLRLLAPVDSPARFFAFCDAPGRALRCEWTGDGTDPAVVARIEFYRNAHPAGDPLFEMPLHVENLINVSLDGPLPPGFEPEQFGNPDEIHQRESAAGTVDNTARQGVTSVQDELHTLKGVLRAV